MQDIKFKSNSGQFNIDQAQGIVECFVAGIGNKDSVGDIVISGAFAKSLMRRKPRVVWGHNWNDPIGKVLEIYEVPPNDPRLPGKMKAAGIGGLYAKVQFNLNSEKGREAFANVAFFGEEQEWSIGYKTLDAIYDNSKQANILREVELYELSPVLHGANQLTGTISVKSEEEKMHMHMMGGPAVPVVEKPKAPVDPFAQGVAQPADSDRMLALEKELASRTGGPVKVMKATESSVVFMKPGKGMFRLGYYFDGEQFMFGKPEKLGATMIMQPVVAQPKPGPRPERIPNFPGVQQKPSSTTPLIPVKYGDTAASGFFDLEDGEKSLADEIDMALSGQKNIDSSFVEKLSGIVGSLQQIIEQHQSEKSEFLIACAPEHAFETKQALDPVFDYHRIESYVTEEGIVIASPLTGDAYEAVENATKSLLGRIGRGIGGGGKVRRGRAALARIEGVLDPRQRRDVDGDGMIFDGTWMEQPDPTRFAARAGNALRSEGPKEPRKDRYATRPPTENIDALIGRAMNDKILRMFDEIISKNQIPEVSPTREVADGFRNGSREGSFLRPKITPELLEKFKPEFEKMKAQFGETGAHKPGEKGATAFDVLNEIVETGKYRRKNVGKNVRGKRGERVGQASAQTGRARTMVVGTGEQLPKIKKRGNELDVSDFTKRGFLPEKWNEMSGDEKIDWLNENEEGLRDLAGKGRPWKWQKVVDSIKDDAFDQSLREWSRRERTASGTKKPAAAKPSAPKVPETPKPQKPAQARELSKNKYVTSINDTLVPYLDKNKDKISGAFRETFDDVIERMKAALEDEDGNMTVETMKNAQEILEDGIVEISTAPKFTPDGKPRKELNRQEDQVIRGLQAISKNLGDDWKQDADRERELDPEQDIAESFERRGRQAIRYGADDDEDARQGADYNDIYETSDVLGSADDDDDYRNSFSMARSFQRANARRKANGTLRSSGKSPRTEVTKESTWWKKIDDSLGKEIREAENDIVKDGLTLLQQKIKKYDAGAFVPGSKRTNVGSIKVSADEADKILDAVMAVIDRQQTAGKGGSVGTRGEIFAELLETVSRAAMSTFIDKTSPTADDK